MSTDIISQTPSNRNPLNFTFGKHKIRVQVDENGIPYFISADVCKALELKNVSQALSRLDVLDKSIIVNDMGVEYPVVTESGLYNLIFSSRTEESANFKRWVTSEVLPSIRKTGGYETPKDLSPIEKSRHLLNVLVSIQDTVEAQQHTLDEHTERIASLEAHVQPESEYFSALGYFRYRNITAPSMNEVQALGQRASRLSKERGLSIGKIADPRFGSVNTYHIAILDELVKG